jgi:uncharacterized phage-associated protein
MASVHDIAAYIEERLGAVSAFKLQKLVYYAQAWSLAWDAEPLFAEVIKAWKHGPVSPELRHQRVKTKVRTGDARQLSPRARKTLDAVLAFYGPMSPQDLIDLSHRETPWRVARARGGESPTITHQAMRAYFRPLAQKTTSKRVPDSLAAGIRLLLATPEDEIDDLFKVDKVRADEVQSWLESGGEDPWRGSSG